MINKGRIWKSQSSIPLDEFQKMEMRVRKKRYLTGISVKIRIQSTAGWQPAAGCAPGSTPAGRASSTHTGRRSELCEMTHKIGRVTNNSFEMKYYYCEFWTEEV
jgi:hypothetical protein